MVLETRGLSAILLSKVHLMASKVDGLSASVSGEFLRDPTVFLDKLKIP